MKKYADQLFLMLEESIPEDTKILITIVFEGMLEIMSGKGFYLSDYLDNNNEKRYFASTHLEARRAFPCFDEPALKAKFSMLIVTEKKHISLFNNPRVHSIPMKNNLVVDAFQQSVKMSSYTVAFSVSEYEGKSKQTKSGINVTVYAPRNDIGNVDYSLEAGVTILDYFESLFEVPYPLPKFDMLAVPFLEAAAMENWGLVTFKSVLLNHSKKSKDTMKLALASVIAHEIAHQWFGNIVTMEWWDDIWLNEGFTTYKQYLGLQTFNRNWSMENEFADRFPGMKCEDFTTTRVLDQPVVVPDPTVFGCISYDKGASIIRMIRSWLDEDNFMAGIKTYLKKNTYDNVIKEDMASFDRFLK